MRQFDSACRTLKISLFTLQSKTCHPLLGLCMYENQILNEGCHLHTVNPNCLLITVARQSALLDDAMLAGQPACCFPSACTLDLCHICCSIHSQIIHPGTSYSWSPRRTFSQSLAKSMLYTPCPRPGTYLCTEKRSMRKVGELQQIR